MIEISVLRSTRKRSALFVTFIYTRKRENRRDFAMLILYLSLYLIYLSMYSVYIKLIYFHYIKLIWLKINPPP